MTEQTRPVECNCAQWPFRHDRNCAAGLRRRRYLIDRRLGVMSDSELVEQCVADEVLAVVEESRRTGLAPTSERLAFFRFATGYGNSALVKLDAALRALSKPRPPTGVTPPTPRLPIRDYSKEVERLFRKRLR